MKTIEMFVLTDMTVDSVTSTDVNRVVGLKLKTVSVKNRSEDVKHIMIWFCTYLKHIHISQVREESGGSLFQTSVEHNVSSLRWENKFD